jgi:glutathione S-transferase
MYFDSPADHPFHGGDSPSAADVTVFGVLRSIHDYDVFADMVANTTVAAWYNRMAAAVGPSCGHE